jgi:choline dehydrogenase-like flavoprotein
VTAPSPSIHQLGDEEVSDQHRDFIASALAAGYERTAGFTTEQPLGVGPYVMNTRMGVRLNTGMTLLGDAVRTRSNLTICDETLVDAVLVEQGKAQGVRLAGGAIVLADEVILSAGTYVSPAILMRSGIGPAEVLRGLDIPVVSDVPVGRRLQDHPLVPTVWSIRKEAVGLAYPPIGAMLWTASSHATSGEADLNISTAPMPDTGQTTDAAMFLLFAALVRPRSVGTLTASAWSMVSKSSGTSRGSSPLPAWWVQNYRRARQSTTAQRSTPHWPPLCRAISIRPPLYPWADRAMPEPWWILTGTFVASRACESSMPRSGLTCPQSQRDSRP